MSQKDLNFPMFVIYLFVSINQSVPAGPTIQLLPRLDS
jgi:hypothetical protein